MLLVRVRVGVELGPTTWSPGTRVSTLHSTRPVVLCVFGPECLELCGVISRRRGERGAGP